MNPLKIFFCVIGMLLGFSAAQSQTITSKATGGSWTDVTTWVGGVVPIQSSDVVIEGPVSVTAGAVCRNITVNGSLESVTYPEGSLTISGSLVNNGLIKNYEGYYGKALTLNVTGNITNNGTIRNSYTNFKGTAEHRLSLASGKTFETNFASLDTLGTFTAYSFLYFRGAFNLKGAALNMQSYALTLEGSGNIYNGSVTNTADLTGKGNAALGNITYKGTINLKSVVIVSTNVVFEGTVTVTDTLQSISYPDGSVTITGSLVNNGLIKNYEAYYGKILTLYVTGNITNNGIMRNSYTNFKGTAEHKVSLGAGKTFETNFTSLDTLSTFTAISPLYFRGAFNLKGAALNMQSYALTLEAGGNIYNGSVTNTADLTGKAGAALANITYKGAINLKSIVIVSTNVVFEGTVTVTDTLQSISYPDGSLTINGNLVNNGLIKNYEAYYGKILTLYVTGNITNNGIMRNSYTNFKGTAEHKLSLGAGKTFETNFTSLDTLAALTASSSLYFRGFMYLKGATLNMQSYALTLEGGGNIYGGTVINTGDLIGKGDASLNNITYKGNINVKSIVIINSNVVFEGTVTVTDTLRSISSPDGRLIVTGNLVNNGLIMDYEAYYWKTLTLTVSGNITNNGVMRNNLTYFKGKSDHKIALGAGKYFLTRFAASDTLASFTAISPLYFKNSFDLKGGSLNMQANALTLDGAGSLTYGTVINTADLISKGDASLNNITYKGNINLKSIVNINLNVVMEGTVTLTDTLRSVSYPDGRLIVTGNLVNNGLIMNYEAYYSRALTLTVSGSLTNNGTIRNSYNNIAGSLVNNKVISGNMYVTGNISSSVKWDAGNIYLTGSGERTVLGSLITCPIHSAGENVVLAGDNYLTNLTVDAKSVCQAAFGSNIYTPETLLDEKLDNHGTIITKRKFSSAQNYSFFRSRVNVLSTNTIDSVIVQSFGRQVPQTFANAVKSYWRITTYAKTPYKSLSSFTMIYDHDLLGSNGEAALQIFNSQDSGKTWIQLSTLTNTTRDLANNSITIIDAPSSGDYLLSSSSDAVSVRPSIITDIIGRTAIRIGAPSRFTLHFVNNSDLFVDDFLMTVNTGSMVHINSAEIPLIDGTKMVLTRDSLFYTASEDTSAFFYVLKMAPREERSFDIVVYGDAPLSKLSSLKKAAFFDPITITAGAVITWAAWKAGTFVVTKAMDYIGDKVEENLKLTPAEQARYDAMVKGGIPTELEQQPGKAKVFGGKIVGGYIAKKLLTLAPAGESALSIAAATTANVKKIAPNLRQRIFNWFYKETGLYGVEETQDGNQYENTVSTATQKKGTLVRSWDPNEKVGPEGFGDKKFITSAGKMMYQILFENKKEATAPAYKVVIVDTLKPEYDPETVEFGKTSHDGAQYAWKKTRVGNILTWSIEGIELPPNVTPPEGEGWVAFTVSPKTGLASGTPLINTATVIFDMNPAIRTNTYQNTLDFQAPVTQMKPLSQKVIGKTIVVKWQSADEANGSGVESVTLYASMDGGPYTAVGTTNADSLVVPSQTGVHKYSFYSLAKDFVGNVESIRPAVITTDATNGIEKVEVLPETYSLSQNYPNPFNPATTIEFSIPAAGDVSIKIYNAIGQETATLVNGVMNPGSYRVQWLASGFSSGVYYCRMQSGAFSEVRKLLLLK